MEAAADFARHAAEELTRLAVQPGEEDSLAENVQRAPLHPLDQFRAFLALREKGLSEEEIAAALFVGVNVAAPRKFQ